MVVQFDSKYATMTDDVEQEEDEKDFNWWTKYFGYKYQKVAKYLKFVSKYKLIVKHIMNRNFVIFKFEY